MKAIDRLEQARLLFKLAERIKKIELYYKATIKELTTYASNPYEFPLFNEDRKKTLAERRLAGIEALKVKYETLLKPKSKGLITEEKLFEYGFKKLEIVDLYIRKVLDTSKESQSINVSKSVMLGNITWSVSLQVYRDGDFTSREDGFFHLRNITTIEELESIIDLCKL